METDRSELERLQAEAVKRVREMQERARRSVAAGNVPPEKAPAERMAGKSGSSSGTEKIQNVQRWSFNERGSHKDTVPPLEPQAHGQRTEPADFEGRHAAPQNRIPSREQGENSPIQRQSRPSAGRQSRERQGT
ncbi:MAG: hypothetical protein LBQ48_02575, partial [Oscillospiraceae bacterium]|nr:hypothetical protein [Oscillospiraceae bacterium]